MLFAILLAMQPPPPIFTVPVSPPPLVRTNVPNRYGAWTVASGSDYSAAYTNNDSGSVFGVMCGTGCVVYTNIQIGCDQGDQYPAMVNSNVGSYSIVLRCYHLEDRNVLTANIDDNFLALFRSTGEVGLAIPLQSGRFAVSRFSLNGSLAATERAAEMAQQRLNAGQQGLRDFTI